jgi:peptidoglycan/xylan/chitin deacetylase (PgdA/CDA1 family)
MDDDVPCLLCGTPALPPHCVALTFDDGPGPRSAELSRMLRDKSVPGTFFVLGEGTIQACRRDRLPADHRPTGPD